MSLILSGTSTCTSDIWKIEKKTLVWVKDVKSELWLEGRGCILMSFEYERCARLQLLWKREKLLRAVWSNLY